MPAIVPLMLCAQLMAAGMASPGCLPPLVQTADGIVCPNATQAYIFAQSRESHSGSPIGCAPETLTIGADDWIPAETAPPYVVGGIHYLMELLFRKNGDSAVLVQWAPGA